MKINDLTVGEKYKCSCFKYARVTLDSIGETYADGSTSVSVLYRGMFYRVSADNLFPADKRHPLEPYKVGTVELSRAEMADLCDNEKYIVSGRKIYQINYSAAQNDYTYQCLYTTLDSMTGRGRFYKMTAAEVNYQLGFDLLRVNA